MTNPIIRRAESTWLDDAELVARLGADDAGAYDALFKAHYAELCRFACGYVHAPDIAEEIVQDVLYRVWQRRRALEIRTTVRAFLYALVRNRALNELRHRRVVERRATLLPAHTDAPAADRPLLAGEMARAIEGVLASLPAKAQRAYRLRYDDQLSYLEIGEAMGLSVKRIESLLRQVRLALRDGLAPFI